MYSSRGSNAYGQQHPYASQSGYDQSLGTAYPGSSVGGPDGGSQLSMASRHSSMLGGRQEADISGYRAQPSSGAHYGGQYGSVYGSTTLGTAQQVPAMSAKGAGPSSLEGRSGYGSAMPESPKFTSGDYVSSSGHGYGHKGDQLFSEKISDYSSIDRREYGERQGAYIGRDLQSEPTGRFAESMGFGHQHQANLYDRMNQASLFHPEQVLKAQPLQSASLDGGSRQADYLAARGATIRHPTQDLLSYGGRMDAEPHSLSMLSGSSFGGQHAPSILGAAPRKDVDDLMYAQSSSNPGYGVSLPPGRDYATGKGLHGTSLESDYLGSMLSRGGHPRIDERKDDRAGYAREHEQREEERRREHLRDREREKERERERQRERERERERDRERERILERREKERDRERKRGLEIRRERTPPRISRDRRGSSLIKDGRSLRRDSPRHEASHRRHSPVKEKRREYVCKVYSSSLVDVERDFLSMDKRYPRLFISPEFSKVIVNWPRENLNLSICTPVSFEHDFVEDTTSEQKGLSVKSSADEPVKSDGVTVWNAKMILMSGLSQNSLEELSSEKSYDDRIPHFCNILRFAVLKKDHSFMAIGGPWDTVDGGDPSVDDSSLVRTVLRYAKEVTELDLKNCRHWNRFLEIHYDRFGEDGLFSHKEVTVLYVPDLSECLPSLETWRDQWLAHKKAIAERERLLPLKKEKSREKKEGLKDKDTDSLKDVKSVDKSETKKESVTSGQAVVAIKKERDCSMLEGNAVEKEGDGCDEKFEKKGVGERAGEGNSVEKKEQGEGAGAQTAVVAKLGKRKIIKKIVKQKVANKKESVKDITKQNDKLDEDVGEKNANSEITGQQDEASANPAGVKTFIRKKIAKKVPVGKSAQKEDEGMQPEVKNQKEAEFSEDVSKGTSDSNSPIVVQDTTVKTTVKRKIIRRVTKRKVTGAGANDGVANSKEDGNNDEKKVVQAGKEVKIMGEQAVAAGNQVSEVESEKKIVPKEKTKTVTPEKQDNTGNSSKTGNKVTTKEDKEEKRTDGKTVSGSKMEIEVDKQKESQKDSHNGKREKSKERDKSKDEKERKDRDGKDESRSKSNKEVKEMKEKKRHEEPPRHPGLFLQVKGSKDSKLHSLSKSLDSLLDYTDKDIEESTFELSLFAESLYEMLQYQMGSRLLTFLQKLRIKFMTKRNQRKRQREEVSGKGSEKKSSTKRTKTDETTEEIKSIKSEAEEEEAAHVDDGKTTVKEEDNSVGRVENVKQEDGTDDDEDPEEDPEEDEEIPDASPQDVSFSEENAGGGAPDTAPKSEKVAENEKDGLQESANESSEMKPKLDAESKEETVAKTDTQKKETSVAVDKELLQAFRFFDRNRVGYIRVEDMRLIIHSLGMFLAHRDVKELVQSALLESNTGRDDRILYTKLVRMSTSLD